MKNLTDNQIDFLLEHFFKNEKFAGWRNIATKLLTTGSCVVAGNDSIWHGGIGNFIKTEAPDGYVDCIVYKFDLEYFLKSGWFKESHCQHISNLTTKKREVEREYEDICNL